MILKSRKMLPFDDMLPRSPNQINLNGTELTKSNDEKRLGWLIAQKMGFDTQFDAQCSC